MEIFRQPNTQTLNGGKFEEELQLHLKALEAELREHYRRVGHRVASAKAGVDISIEIAYESGEGDDGPTWSVSTEFKRKYPKYPKLVRQAFIEDGEPLRVDTRAPKDPPPIQYPLFTIDPETGECVIPGSSSLDTGDLPSESLTSEFGLNT